MLRPSIIIGLLMTPLALFAQNEGVNVNDLNNLEDGFSNEDQAPLENNFNNSEINQPADELGDQMTSGDEDIDMEVMQESEAPENSITPYRLQGPMIRKMDKPNLFSGAPPMPGTMRGMAIGEAPEEYPVELGDTLFDICDQLIDEPGYWPKLWSLNTFIRNPHFIYPGMKLSFYTGDSETPPFLKVVTEDGVVPVDRGGLSEEEVLEPEMGELLSKRLDSPDQIQVVAPEELKRFSEIDEGFVKRGSVFSTDHQKIIIPAFFFPEEVSELGVVVSGTSGSFLMDSGKDLVIEKEEELGLDQTLTVVRYTDEIDHPKTGDTVGYRYEFIGHIKTLKQFPEDEDLLSGKVIYSRAGIRPGDLLIPFKSVNRKVPFKYSSNESGNHHVVGFDFPSSFLGGRGSFVFLEQGQGQLQVGSAVKVFQDVRRVALSLGSSDLPEHRKQVSDAYVVDNEGAVATAFIVSDSSETRTGDSTSSQSQEE